MASTCKRDESLHSRRQLPHFTPTWIDRARERPCLDIPVYPFFQSRSKIVNVCLVLRMGSQPRGSRYVEEMVSDGTVITYKSVGTQCSGECFSKTTSNTNISYCGQTVVSYIYRQGGKNLQSCGQWHGWFYTDVTFGVYSFEKHTFLGKNVIANQLSRRRQIPKMTELSLNQDVVQRLFRVYSTPNIDLFATKENENYQSFFLHSKII